jgi:hypothetical protein
MRNIAKLSFLVLCIAVGLVMTFAIANAQTYFSDNFDDPDESAGKWHPLFGQWEFNDDEYHALAFAVNCMSVISDEFWNDDWNEYTFEVRGNKIAGAEGFLIMFRCKGIMQPRGMVLEDPPPRMEDDGTNLEYWWNLGGWGNARSQVESWGGVGGVNSDHTINTDEWYDIKIVNTPDSYTLFLNDEEVGSSADGTENGEGRVGLATWSTTARFDDVIVYGPDGPSAEAVDPGGKVTTTWAHIKSDPR